MAERTRRKAKTTPPVADQVPMEQIEKRMVDLKRTIDASKTHRAEFVGAERQTLAALKDRFGVEGIDAAEATHVQRQGDVQERRDRVQQLYATLTEEFEW